MRLETQRVLLTGAGGGMGRLVARMLAEKGAWICALEHSPDAAETLRAELEPLGARPLVAIGDVTRADARAAAIALAEREWGGIDILINLAGVLELRRFQDTDPAAVSRLLAVNLEAPMLLAREVLPGMLRYGHGRIVNVGSMFGSIGFPLFAAYSASKFALRGFSQALRRELTGTGVGVTYIAPRAVRTALNPPVVHAMAAHGLMRMDEPEPVAAAMVQAIERERNEVYLGQPEGFFAGVNAILPGLVDGALAKQLPALIDHLDGVDEGMPNCQPREQSA
ncbi:MAG: SDR family oxidoreductase [Thiohalocapsa sp.]|jgi:NAD(P)-dependent dehydrogenase (short-subunit alcohol dehydrogenase family)|uniref:SDR family oxidoreductase n=1 Tax=Thiohalocapsa sp. TaxID=2497641 RepID=UPI0025F2B1EE|nr:SDR family oxidoreductase [Thiohalocapsa sp.]MCG6943150.1 SDR family oxidoreductase [Thiohalocapsa sp.]